MLARDCLGVLPVLAEWVVRGELGAKLVAPQRGELVPNGSRSNR